jgi:hypothetical protein
VSSLRPFFCYYGGKWRAAPRYPAPEHDTIVEPFAGAAGYSTRYADRNVVLVDRDPIIAGLWAYLTKVSEAEILTLPADVPGAVADLPVCQEARWLIGFWINKGSAAPRNVPSTWMRGGTRPKSYWGKEVRAIIASQVDKIRHWKVIEGSYERAPDLRATWFVDPPYEKAGKHYRFGSKQLEYEGLAAWCVSRDGTTIVCENVGATWLPFEPFAKIAANRSVNGGKFSDEAIWIQRRRDRLLSDVEIHEAIVGGIRDAG